MKECQHVNSQQPGPVHCRGGTSCRLFAKSADGLSLCRAERAATARNSPRFWTCCGGATLIFSAHWPHFSVRRRQKRWSDGCWLAAFSDGDEGFVLWRRAPLLLQRHCSGSSHSRNVTAKSVKPQQRPLLFFNTVEVKKKKKCDLENKYATSEIPLCVSILFFSRTEKSEWREFHLSFTTRTFSSGGSRKWTTSKMCANDALATCI